MKKLITFSLGLVVCLSSVACDPFAITTPPKMKYQPTALPVPTNKELTPELCGRIEKSIARGVDFLVKTQNRDGSWGSSRKTKGLNILNPVPSGHDNYREACTALCVASLIEAQSKDPAAIRAFERAQKWMFKRSPKIKRSSQGVVYNLWVHAYFIEAFVRMYNRLPENAPERVELLKHIRKQVAFLGMYETTNGGWAYYSQDPFTRRTVSSPTSFATSTCLIALLKAKSVGVKVPARLLRRAYAVVLRLRSPNFTYVYDDRFKLLRGGQDFSLPGSLGRSQVCNLASRMYGDKNITDELLELWAERLIVKNCWLSRGRKTPRPHENWFGIAGYYYYYGHYYALECVELLPEAKQHKYQARLAEILMRHQEGNDGSWWDFPVYNYGKYFGTPFAIMSLSRCRVEPAKEKK